MDYFRHLLAMSPQQRQAFLAAKPPAVRQRLLAKVNEYAALDPTDCEMRLRATELRLYLLPLLRASPEDRPAQLALVPDNIRDVVNARLMQWEILPPNLQHEFLENEHILGYFSGLNTTNTSADDSTAPSDAERSHWDALPDGERSAMLGQFNQFFALSPVQKQQAIGGLPGTERTQMEKAMQAFDKMPEPQRSECIRAYAKFASLTPLQRRMFLKNAERWSQMSPAERKAWGDLAEHVPQWPPANSSVLMPPMPAMPAAHPNFHPVTATNHS
jgi:hypothetical protein